jgi:hypothetical protein
MASTAAFMLLLTFMCWCATAPPMGAAASAVDLRKAGAVLAHAANTNGGYPFNPKQPVAPTASGSQSLTAQVYR